MAQTAKKPALLRKQVIMRKVVAALLPCVAGAVYFFGWRSLVMVLFCVAAGFLFEWLFCRARNEPVSEAVFVTAVLFALIMPPGVGWHVLFIGMGIAVIFSKEVFGGFGRNIFNPAMAGRCFVYICFPVALTAQWYPAAQGPWGALDRWSTGSGADSQAAVTGATPMAYMKNGALITLKDPVQAPRQADVQEMTREGRTFKGLSNEVPFVIAEDQAVAVSYWRLQSRLFFGCVSGTMGVTSVLLILIGGVYLFWTKTANRTIILSVIVPYAIFSQVLYWLGVPPVQDALTALLGGGFLLGAFFMATDPVSSPRTEIARILYGLIIAVSALVIRNFSIFNGGLMFAILLGNMFGPILDYSVKAWQGRGKHGDEPKGAAA
ncbi:MAG: RnfABCDGE type electron transport complex subunit D [Planctomycetaceae bacterium]|nr:RnfABCDGE type electron transport complex subunit D [Planctomycetaceae bacterium]